MALLDLAVYFYKINYRNALRNIKNKTKNVTGSTNINTRINLVLTPPVYEPMPRASPPKVDCASAIIKATTAIKAVTIKDANNDFSEFAILIFNQFQSNQLSL